MKARELPTQAGPVGINFDPSFELPTVKREMGSAGMLRLPLRPGMRVYPIKDGENLIVTYDAPLKVEWWAQESTRFKLRYPVEVQNPVFFAGYDESAFAVLIEPEALSTFLSEGEAAFYHSLKPAAIKRLEKAYPDAPVGRQGDIWHLKLPMRWREVPARGKPQPSGHVLSTNHVIRGGYYPVRNVSGLRNTAIGYGILTARDHADRNLDGPHALARTVRIRTLGAEVPELARGFGYD